MKKLLTRLSFILLVLLFAVAVRGEAPTLPALAVTVEDYVYGSERSTPSVSGNVEGGSERYFVRSYEQNGGEWREITQRPVSLGMPTEGGRYELKVTVGATESYCGGSALCDFYVRPTDLDVGLIVKDSISFGDSCAEGSLFSLSDLLGRQYSVSYSRKGSGIFTSAPPTEIGSYVLKVSVNASKNFNATEKSAEFEITKRSVEGELRLDDITVIYGGDEGIAPLPVYTGNSEAVRNELLRLSPISEYRPLGSSGAFSPTTPTEVGEYEIRVSYTQSQNLHAASVTAVLRITRSPIYPTVSISGWIFGETPNEPRLSDGSNPGRGRVYYYYCPEGGEYSTAFPTDAGDYTLKAVIEPSEGYAGGECFAEFTIEKAARSEARLVFGDIKYGETLPAPYVSGTLDGAAVTFSYTLRGENNYSSVPPTESGAYTLRAEIAEGKNYKARTITFDFIIEKAEIYPSVFVADRVYGEKGETIAVGGNDGDGEYTLTYYVKTDSGYIPVPREELIDGSPFLAGDYKVICQIAETKNHKSGSSEWKFTIDRAAPVLSLTMENYTFYGKAPTPILSGNTESGGVSFVYYPADGDISGGSYDVSEIVTSPGEYTVAAVVSQTKNYKTATVTANFTVLKADLPVSSMSLTVKSGGSEVGQIVYGREYELSLKNNVGYGAVSFAFQSGDGEFRAEKPTAVGNYKVKATVSATEVYKSLTVFFDITIVKAERDDLKLESAEWIFGDVRGNITVTGDTRELNEGNMSYSYKPSGEPDSEYSTEIPTKTGKYTVKLTVAETESFHGCEIIGELTIKKGASVITVQNTEGVYTGEAIDISASLNHSEAELVYSGEKPMDVGVYTVTVSVPESENYEGASLTVTFTVFPAEGRIDEIIMPDSVWNGEAVAAPEYSVTGDGEVRVEYYKNGELLSAPPTEIGDYTVRVVLSNGKNYVGCYAERAFKITSPIKVTESEAESTAKVAPPSNKENKSAVWIVIIMLMVAVIAGAVTIIIIMKNKKDDDGDGGDRRDALPPSDGEGRDAIDSPKEFDALGEGDRDIVDLGGEEDKEDEKNSNSERRERLTDSGKIALDMWLTNENESPEDEVVYRKRGRYAEINLDTVCRHFRDGEVVDLDTLKAKGLIHKGCRRVKLLGRGELTKDLDIRLSDCSKSVRETMEEKLIHK